MDPRLYRHICPGRVVNIQRSHGEQQSEAPGRAGISAAGSGGGVRGYFPTFLLSGLIHKATVKTVEVQQRSVSVEWYEAGVVKGKEVRAVRRPAYPRVCGTRPRVARRALVTACLQGLLRAAVPCSLTPLLRWARSVPAAAIALLFLHKSPSGLEQLKREGRGPQRCTGRYGTLRIVMGRAGSVRARRIVAVLGGAGGRHSWVCIDSLGAVAENAVALACGLNAEPFISPGLSSSLKFISVSAVTS